MIDQSFRNASGVFAVNQDTGNVNNQAVLRSVTVVDRPGVQGLEFDGIVVVRPAEIEAESATGAATTPQPMSTPTAAGMIASAVGMTEPMVAPLPRWASGMSAT